MSYVRFHWGGSDLYVYGSVDALVCCGCALDDRHWNHTPSEMIEHLARHRAADHVVAPNLERVIYDEWRDGELEDYGEPFDPNFPEPSPFDSAAQLDWDREVALDLGYLGPIYKRPCVDRDGSPR